MATVGRDRSIGRVSAALYLSPHPTPDLDPEPALVALVASARTRLRFAVYSFSLPAVAAAVVAAHARGVDVLGVGDAAEWTGPTSQFPSLAAAGVPVRRWGAAYRLMHDKVAVVDGKRLALGSYNWTTQAERSNVECLLVCTGATGCSLLEAQIEAAYAAGT